MKNTPKMQAECTTAHGLLILLKLCKFKTAWTT